MVDQIAKFVNPTVYKTLLEQNLLLIQSLIIESARSRGFTRGIYRNIHQWVSPSNTSPGSHPTTFCKKRPAEMC